MGKRVAFITGAGEGLGKATAFELARQGYALVIGEIDPEKGYIAIQELLAAGFEAIFVPLDATNEESVKAATLAITQRFGYLSVLVNNVGSYQEQSFEQMSVADWTSAININLTSVFLSTKYSLPLIEKAEGTKVIVNLSSNLAKIAEPLAPAYCATKAGVDMLTRCLALEYASRGIRVVAIAPGPVGRSEADLDTVPADAEEEEMRQFNPLKRFATPEEVAHFIAYMVSDKASYMTGCTVALDGGETANPASWSVMKRIKDYGQV